VIGARPRRRRAGAARAVAAVVVVALTLLAVTPPPAGARILKTRRPGGAAGPLELAVGSGFEYETDGEESEYGFPFLVEYGLTPVLKASLEPSWVWLRKKAGGSTSAPGDLETAFTLELPTERRYRPGVGFEAVVKWPTAKTPDLGTGKTDLSLGGIVSKEFVRFDLDFNASYTFIGSPAGVPLQNVIELSLASEYHLSPTLDLEAEIVTASGAGARKHAITFGSFANIGGPEQGERETEGTIGLAEKLSEYLKFEEGVVVKSGNSYQILFAWEFDFAGQ
jgi:hypothetical protein